MPQPPLNSTPLIRTQSIEALEASVCQQYGSAKIDVIRNSRNFDVTANHSELRRIGLTYASHGAPIQISFSSAAFYAQLFCLGGSARVSNGRKEVDVEASKAFVSTPDGPLRLRYSGDFEQLALKLNSTALTEALASLCGEQVREQFRFEPEIDLRRGYARELHQRVLSLVGLLSVKGDEIQATALAELEQSIIVSFLHANRHNYSYLLEQKTRLLARSQLKLAEEYIEANWDKPLYIEMLSAVTGVSARSIFYDFRRKYGYSPMAFVRQVRLDHARNLLCKPTSMTTVTDVALACGFGNLGHFASYYRQTFGETPSATLQKAKRRE